MMNSLMSNLERNLIDNILESEVKLGCAGTTITFYYPATSLVELLDCDMDGLDSAIVQFLENEKNRLGEVVLEKLDDEKGRYAVRIPLEGINWVLANFQPSDFMKDFVKEIKRPENTLERVAELFYEYSPDVHIDKVKVDEWAIYFRDEAIDPYVYYIEQSIFGLEYHRFTRASYRMMTQGG